MKNRYQHMHDIYIIFTKISKAFVKFIYIWYICNKYIQLMSYFSIYKFFYDKRVRVIRHVSTNIHLTWMRICRENNTLPFPLLHFETDRHIYLNRNWNVIIILTFYISTINYIIDFFFKIKDDFEMINFIFPLMFCKIYRHYI